MAETQLPPVGTPEYTWWAKGAADEAAARNEGLSADAITVRETLDALARSGRGDAAELATSLATIFLAGQPLRTRLELALRLVCQ